MQMGGGPRILLRADVQKELSITEEQKKSLETALQGQGGRGGFGGGPGGGGGERPTPEEMQKRQAETEAAVKKVLNETQYKRYEELRLQREGAGALNRPDIQTKLGFTEEQKQKVRSIQQAQQDNMRARMEEMRNGGGGGDRETMMAEFQKMREANDKQLLAVLTPTQTQKFNELKGKPFKFEEGRGG
jgi:hypothetical protein